MYLSRRACFENLPSLEEQKKNNVITNIDLIKYILVLTVSTVSI